MKMLSNITFFQRIFYWLSFQVTIKSLSHSWNRS